MTSKPGVVLAAAVLMGLAVGCTTAKSDTPGTPTTSAEASAPASATPTVAIPPRPKELKLDGVDPCKLFTKAQLDELKVSREPRPRTPTNEDPRLQGPECVLSVDKEEPFYTYKVRLLTNEGIEPWLTGRRNVDARLVSVGGFPAVDMDLRGPGAVECVTSVGVAEGQQLSVGMDPISPRSFSYEQMCQMSERAAGMALQTLQTLK